MLFLHTWVLIYLKSTTNEFFNGKTNKGCNKEWKNLKNVFHYKFDTMKFDFYRLLISINQYQATWMDYIWFIFCVITMIRACYIYSKSLRIFDTTLLGIPMKINIEYKEKRIFYFPKILIHFLFSDDIHRINNVSIFSSY